MAARSKTAKPRDAATDALSRERRSVARLGRLVLEETLDHVYGHGARRTFSGAPVAALERLFERPLPRRGRSPAASVRELRRTLFRHSMQMSHARLFGLLSPAPLPIAALAELPAAFLNQSLDVWKASPAATQIELRLIRWFNDLIGFGPRAFGVLTSGGGVANLIALKMARDRALGGDARRGGVVAEARRLRVYASEHAHFSIERALDVLGLGERALVRVATDGTHKLAPAALAAALEGDRRRGLRPMAVVATAGTTNAGVVDPLAPLARLARAAGAHYHVDAAYGGALVFSARHRGRLRGIERADTVTVDPHKWLFQPFSLGALFVRERRLLARSFRTDPGYLSKSLDPEPDRVDFYHYSLEGSRPFRGLKLWLSLATLGRSGMAALVDRTIEVTRHLERAVRAQSCFEICRAPVELANVCFRYLPRWARGAATRRGERTRQRLNRVQVQLQQEVERRGFAWFPAVVLQKDVYLRFGISNYRTSERDVDATLAHIRRTASRLGLDT
jgi:aromatic-L-amino-acid decarboxylase